jgi:hypothetical protein
MYYRPQTEEHQTFIDTTPIDIPVLTSRQHEALSYARTIFTDASILRSHALGGLDSGEFHPLMNLPFGTMARAIYHGYVVQSDHPLKREYEKHDSKESEWARGYRAGIRNTLLLTNQTIDGIDVNKVDFEPVIVLKEVAIR